MVMRGKEGLQLLFFYPNPNVEGRAAREDVVMVRNYRIAGIMTACGEDDGCRWAVRRNHVQAQSRHCGGVCFSSQLWVQLSRSIRTDTCTKTGLRTVPKNLKCLFQERWGIYQLVCSLIRDQISRAPMNVAFNLCGSASGFTNKFWDHEKRDPVGQFVRDHAEEEYDVLVRVEYEPWSWQSPPRPISSTCCQFVAGPHRNKHWTKKQKVCCPFQSAAVSLGKTP